MKIHTAVIQNPDRWGVVTIAALTEDDLHAMLREAYDSEDEYANVLNGDLVEHIANEQRLTITVDTHYATEAAVMVKGNPSDGFEVVGPYYSQSAAVEAGDTVTSDWWVMPLQDPED